MFNFFIFYFFIFNVFRPLDFYALGREKILVHLKDIFRCLRRSVVHPHRQCKGTKNSRPLQIIIPKTIIFEGYFSPNFLQKIILMGWAVIREIVSSTILTFLLLTFLLFPVFKISRTKTIVIYNIYIIYNY